MEFQFRQLTEEDYDNILLGWWEEWGWGAPTKEFLPLNGTGGLIVFDGETPVCAGFIYTTNSMVSWVDWIISSKTYRKKPQRSEAVKLLIEQLTNASEGSGSKYCYALLKHDGLIETYKEIGYIEGDSYSKEMIKIL